MTITEDSKLTKKQVKTETHFYTENGVKYEIRAELRFDDECGNGHNSFALTGQIWEFRKGRRVEYSAGCIHDDIVKHFPHLAPYTKWHLCSTDGPMHYIANTVYLAGVRGFDGAMKGEPRAFTTFLQFGDNPIKHKLSASFAKFLQACGPRYDFEVIRYDHDNARGETFKFAPKFTFGGYASKWHECPFDTESEALDFLAALQTCNPKFVRVPTAWGEGKERELKAARNAAIWPDGTDEELSTEPEILKAALAVRLPGLLAEFRSAMESLGFVW